jgi:DNA-binding PadR family transcriptional regulator
MIGGFEDPLGLVEFAVIDAVNRGALRSRQTADRVPGLRHEPAGDALVNEALRRCERRGLLWSKRVRSGRRYEVTAAGRARLRADRRFRAALFGVLARG